VVQCRRGRLGALPNRAAGIVVRKTNESDRKFAISMRTRSALLSRRYRFRGSRQNERLARTGESQVGKIICALKLEKSVRDIAAVCARSAPIPCADLAGLMPSVMAARSAEARTCRLWRRSSRGISTGFRYIRVAAAQHAAPWMGVDSGAETASQAGTAIALPRRRSGVEVRAPRSQPPVKRRVTAPRR
jgi:hypothetical protein